MEEEKQENRESTLLGEGSYGSVYKVWDDLKQEWYAEKNIKAGVALPKGDLLALDYWDDNINVVRTKGMGFQDNKFKIYMELCETSLENWLASNKKMDEEKARNCLEQIVNGYTALYKKKILHRDIKPGNILIKNGIYKIADFGLCKVLENPLEEAQHTSGIGSTIYKSLQNLRDLNYSIKHDVWSLGVVIYECYYGFLPFINKPINDIFKIGLIPEHYIQAIENSWGLQFDNKYRELINQPERLGKEIVGRNYTISPRLILNCDSELDEILRKMLKPLEEDRISWLELFSVLGITFEERLAENL